MTSMVSTSSAFATLFGPWFGLIDHRTAWRTFHDSPFESSRRFSAWFGRSGGCSQLCHNGGHGSSYLLWRSFPLGALPGTQHRLHLRLCQHQMIMHDGDDLAPAFKLRWGTQLGMCPQQALLLETIAMFVRVAPPIAQGYLRDAGLRLAVPQKPTLARVARLIGGPMTHHTDDGHLQVPCLRQMQPVPPGDLNGVAFRIAALPSASPYVLGSPH